MDMHGKDAWRRVRRARTPDRLRSRPLQGSPLVDPESPLGRAMVRSSMLGNDRAESHRVHQILVRGIRGSDLRERLLLSDERNGVDTLRRLAAVRRRNVTTEDT